MPSIKLKKKTQEYLAEKERSKKNVKDSDHEPDMEVNKKVPKEVSKDQKPKKKETIPDESVLFLEKRKRTVPPGEQKLLDWLSDHVESREGACVSNQILFEYFTDFCAQENFPVTIDPIHFNRVVKDKYGKEVGIKEASPYKGLIKETKPKPKQMKVKAESLTKKMKDIIEEVLKESGNPSCGVRFPTLKMTIGNKYPALQVDLMPNKLVTALERGVYYGTVELVRGTGKCGYYRLYGVEPREDIKEKEEKEKEKEKQRREEKLQKKKEKKESEKENKEEGEGETNETEKEPPKKKGTKRSIAKAEETTDGEPKKKKKKRKIKKLTWERGDPHSNPEKIEDTFPLAFTYTSEPKDASFKKIVKYITDYYPSVNADTRLKPALEKGIEKGLWEQCTGTSTATGSFRLKLDDFNPESSKTIDDMICQAIVASHEPKQSTAMRLKQYLIDYHPDFNVESRPHNFKKSIERALKKGSIKQLTGIGLSGTFQLSNPFVPSPNTLAGSEDSEGHWVTADEVVSDEKYVVRKTKSGRYSGKRA